jgi:putative GTP pyrophosphokinase
MAKKARKKKPAQRDLATLETQYKTLAPLAGQFADELEHQIHQLIQEHGVLLSLPLQKRVKAWSSIAEKTGRKSIDLDNLKNLSDLVGLRIIVQFSRDLETIRGLLRCRFNVIEEYDTGERLKEDQFGYSSIHFVLQLPDTWLHVPTMAPMKGLRAEIQLRTTAQHIWAAASHALQYKHEESVPLPIRRAIHRVSALLETVDLEFDRVLQQRDSYRVEIGPASADEQLNVDLIENVLDSVFPAKNKSVGDEPYASLLAELEDRRVTTIRKLEELLRKHRNVAIAEDTELVEYVRSGRTDGPSLMPDDQMILRGAFYSHVGLARIALSREFGEHWYLGKSAPSSG